MDNIIEEKMLLKIEEIDNIQEEYRGGLRAWFGKGPVGSASGGGWDRYNTKGEKIGKCGDAKKGSSYSACLGKKYAKKLGKKGRASFVRRKKSAQRNAGKGKKGTGSKGKSPVRVSYEPKK